MSSKKNNDTLMNILRGNNAWNKNAYGGISGEVKDTKDYIKSGTAYTDDAAQKIRAGFAADGGKAKSSAVASNAADNGGNPDSYAGAQADKANIAYRSAGEEAVRSRAASSEGGLITSDQNLISAFGTAAGANSADLATGMQYNNNLANTEVSSGSVGSDEKQSGANNDALMEILKGNIAWNKKTNDDISSEVKVTKQYIKDGTAYTDEAADAIRGSFGNGEASSDDTYGAGQKNRTDGAYGAAAENAVIARAAQTESHLTESDLNLINAFKTAADANSADLATGMEYNADLSGAEAAAANESAGGGTGGKKTSYSDDQLIYAYYNYIHGKTEGKTVKENSENEDAIKWISEHADVDEEQLGRLKEALGADAELYSDSMQPIKYAKLLSQGLVLLPPEAFYNALASGDTSKTLGMPSYAEYIEALNSLNEEE